MALCLPTLTVDQLVDLTLDPELVEMLVVGCYDPAACAITQAYTVEQVVGCYTADDATVALSTEWAAVVGFYTSRGNDMSCGQAGNVGCIFKGSDATILARVYSNSTGLPILKEEIERIQQTVFDLADVDNPTDQRDLDKEVVFFDTLQNDGRWVVDDIGYNFRNIVEGAFLTGTINRVEVLFYLFDGSIVPLDPFAFQSMPMYSI